MKQISFYIVLIMLGIGTAALFISPLLQPETVVVMRMGLGAAIFAGLFILAVLIGTGSYAHERGKEQATRKVNREQDESHRQFLRRLDHELKNPLTGLQASLTNLREARSTADSQAAVDNASLAVTRLGRILRDLRKLAELSAEMLEHRKLDMAELVTEMVSAASSLPAYQDRNINLLVSKVPSLPAITGDQDMLGLAFYNLLDNALKYSAPGDAIEVRVREDGQTLFIDVADGGAGISAQEQVRIFEDLYRGENARETEGSGLGLALARRIVQLHGGDISLRSEPTQGRGTVFTIQLPTRK